MRKRGKSHKTIVAIDGPAGSGKSTVARRVARALRLPYIDTGAMYRALTWLASREGIAWENKSKLVQLARTARISFKQRGREVQRVYINGRDVTREIRSPELTKKVHYVASEKRVRQCMVVKQRSLGRRVGGVLEGRDIGTVVFSRADHKFFLNAEFAVRVERRFLELKSRGIRLSRKALAQDLLERDTRDRQRKVGPLKRAKDALAIDTSCLTVSQVVRTLLKVIEH